MNAAHIVCPICRPQKEARRRFTSRGHNIFACLDCGHGFAPDALRTDFVYDATYYRRSEDHYGYPDYLAEEAGMRATARRRLARLSTASSRFESVLEIGCAHGFFLDEARHLGFRVEGHDVSMAAVEWGRNALNLPLHEGNIESPNWQVFWPPFSIIALWDTLEHLKNPVDALQKLAGVLAPGGIVAATTGDFGSAVARIRGPRWRLIKPPEHLHYFTRTSLRSAFAAAGLAVETMHAERQHVSIGYVLHRLGLPRGLTRLCQGPAISVGIGDVVFAVARG